MRLSQQLEGGRTGSAAGTAADLDSDGQAQNRQTFPRGSLDDACSIVAGKEHPPNTDPPQKSQAKFCDYGRGKNAGKEGWRPVSKSQHSR